MGEPRSGELVPVVPGFYPDPTICRVGGDYYLAHSSFEYFPGAPIFHSTDLVTWTQVGNVLDRRSQFRRGNGRPSGGIYGSTLRHHDGRFWFVTTNVSDYEAGQVIVHAEDPAGPWSEPIHVPQALGIDPDLCWDTGGTCLLTWHSLDFGSGEQDIRQAPLDPWTGALLATPYPVWQGTGMVAAEGPHLYRVREHWYLMLAEGGTERGHSVTIARAPSPRGPWEPCPDNPILTRRSTGHPVQNTGHADLVETANGGWAAVYLGVRTQPAAPGFHVLGRETFLAGIDWLDGWPRFDSDRFVIETRTAFVDEFRGARLDARWVVPAGEPDAVVALGDGLRLRPASADQPLCVRVRDLRWVAEASMSGGRFAVRMDPRHWFALDHDGERVRATVRIGDVSAEVGSMPLAGDAVLRPPDVGLIRPYPPPVSTPSRPERRPR